MSIEFTGDLVRLLRDTSPDAWMYDEEDIPFQCSISASEEEERCANCGGSGAYAFKICKRCQGTGIEIER